MRRFFLITAVLTVASVGGYAVWAVAERADAPDAAPASSATAAQSCDPAACASPSASKVAAAKPKGKVLGNFDTAVAGACQFACAIKSDYDEKDLAAQPGARKGQLTQCPVSGVAFKIDAKRPHVKIGKDDYATCCEGCAAKLRAKPARFVKV